ncbi:MAG TPA: hypothetical protein VE907_04555 [Gammaproteobacteria bacterium]|nr:hypothetical protein [Gammaproteobacteria bacterium]
MNMASGRSSLWCALAVAVGVALAGAAGAQPSTAKNWKPPRTSWGDPDLAGIYSNDDETGTPMERPKEYDGLTAKELTPEKIKEISAQRAKAFRELAEGPRWANSISPPPYLIFDTFDRNNRRPWLVVEPADGKIPPVVDAAKGRRQGRGVSTNANSNGPFNSYLDMGLYDRCITRGIPSSMMPAGYGSRYEIVQAPDSVAIRYEMIHETRVIPLDRRPHVASDLKQYLGDARGWWDGDTLVVETTNFRGDTAPQRSSESVKMVERFKRTASDSVEWTVTFEDPNTWTQPWTFSMPLMQVDASQQIYEYACHEGNLAMSHILSGARAKEAAAKAGEPSAAPRAEAR